MALSRTEFPITAFKRVPWGGINGEADIPVLGVDWSAGTFSMELRNEPGDTGDPLVTLSNAAAGAEGFSTTYDAGYLHPSDLDENGDPLVTGATIIRPQINETTLEGLSYGADPSEPVKLFYDIHATVSGLGKFVLLAGTFTIKPGVTL